MLEGDSSEIPVKVAEEFFGIFPWMFSTKHCFEKKKPIKMIGHHSPFRDVWANLTLFIFMPVLMLITYVIHWSALNFAAVRNIVYLSNTWDKT